MEIEVARRNMLTQQIRACDVLNEQLLAAFASTPREQFVPAEFKEVAFADQRIPLAHGQVMMTPREEGKMLQALNIGADDNVLEIGTGTGYITAIISKLAKYVHSVDIFPEFVESAQRLLKAQGCHNVNISTGDAAKGWSDNGPFDVICITGSMASLPESYLQLLSADGRLFAILGNAPTMRATLITRSDAGEWQQQILFETNIVPLVNAGAKERFTF